jgi:hypothetical protein
MASVTLSKHDLNVLEMIKDPESKPSAPILIGDSLPRDPHITDSSLYQRITERERDVILSMQQLELQIAGLKPAETSPSPTDQYRSCVSRLDELINDFSDYASARNNRAQALRRIYGDSMLLLNSGMSGALDECATDADVAIASRTALSDLDRTISLLSPRTPLAALSPQAAKTLSQAYTQRGALYYLTAKHLSEDSTNLRIDESRKEAKWTKVDFEENSSRDFIMGGRYGNEIAGALAVSANPTAKLCGNMVREAMKKEYGGGGRTVI